MKTSRIIIAVIGCMAGVLLNSCQSKEQKVENAEENVAKANADLDQARREFRAEYEENLNENDRMILEYRNKMNEQSEATRAEYKAHVDELERRNKELRSRLDNTNEQTDDKWESFKREFKHDMDELGNSFKDIGKNNVK